MGAAKPRKPGAQQPGRKLNALRKIVKDREERSAAIHGVTKTQAQLSD